MIKEVIQSEYIQRKRELFGISEQELWNIFYESGCEYLENLKVRIRKKRDFDRLFQSVRMEENYKKSTPKQVFTTLLYSPEFWVWWSVNMCVVANLPDILDKTEFEYRLRFTSNLIPDLTIQKVFKQYGQQKFKKHSGAKSQFRGTFAISKN